MLENPFKSFDQLTVFQCCSHLGVGCLSLHAFVEWGNEHFIEGVLFQVGDNVGICIKMILLGNHRQDIESLESLVRNDFPVTNVVPVNVLH